MDKHQFLEKYIRTKNKRRKIITYRDDNRIRELHEEIASYITQKTMPSIFSKAYIKKRSIITNARSHMFNDVFVLLDIENFFSNINHLKLIDALYFEMNKGHKHVSKIDCTKIVEYCSVGKKGLPIGFVTSPILSNLYLKEFDNILYGKLKKLNLQNPIYTRYADDLVISFKKHSRYEDTITSEIQSIISELLKRFNLSLNVNKTRLIDLDLSNHVKITGINIIKTPENYRKLSVGKKKKNELYWSAINYLSKKENRREPKEKYKIKGMQSFILSVEKTGYEDSFSNAMREKVRELGYDSLKELIDDL